MLYDGTDEGLRRFSMRHSTRNLTQSANQHPWFVRLMNKRRWLVHANKLFYLSEALLDKRNTLGMKYKKKSLIES